MNKKKLPRQAVIFIACIVLCLVVAICFALKPQM